MNQKCTTYDSHYVNVIFSAELPRDGKMVEHESRNETESADEERIYGVVDEVPSSELSRCQQATPTAHSPLPCSIQFAKPDIAPENDDYEELSDPAHSSSSVVAHYQKLCHHFESRTTGMDEGTKLPKDQRILKNELVEETEYMDKDPIYSLVDDIPSSELNPCQQASPVTKPDLAPKNDDYEEVSNPTNASNAAIEYYQQPLHHFKVCTIGMDEGGYMEMTAGVQ